MYEKAIGKYEKLLKEENASYSVRATEQYCNVRAKFYVYEIKKSGKKISDVEALMKKVIKDMESLISFSSTLERLNILASSYKRYALISSSKKKQSAYENAALYYRQSYYDTANKSRYYPLTNWLTIENALVMAGLRKWGATLKNYTMPKEDEALKMLQDESDQIDKLSKEEMDYWDMGAKVNIKLCLLQLDPAHTEVKEVMSDFKALWEYAGSDGNLQTEIEQLEFLEDALSMATPKKAKTVLDKIAAYRSFLEAL
ncbi:MAG TPA: tetratricopeptide repeat-containing protein [Methylotenera sp.]|nr:tetratricopeptide repeat-containing protein [Methylotenera sp.]